MANSAPKKPAFALLPQEALIEFKQIYKEEFGIELSDEEAATKAIAVLNIFKIFATTLVQKK